MIYSTKSARDRIREYFFPDADYKTFVTEYSKLKLADIREMAEEIKREEDKKYRT